MAFALGEPVACRMLCLQAATVCDWPGLLLGAGVVGGAVEVLDPGAGLPVAPPAGLPFLAWASTPAAAALLFAAFEALLPAAAVPVAPVELLLPAAALPVAPVELLCAAAAPLVAAVEVFWPPELELPLPPQPATSAPPASATTVHVHSFPIIDPSSLGERLRAGAPAVWQL